MRIAYRVELGGEEIGFISTESRSRGRVGPWHRRFAGRGIETNPETGRDAKICRTSRSIMVLSVCYVHSGRFIICWRFPVITTQPKVVLSSLCGRGPSRVSDLIERFYIVEHNLEQCIGVWWSHGCLSQHPWSCLLSLASNCENSSYSMINHYLQTNYLSAKWSIVVTRIYLPFILWKCRYLIGDALLYLHPCKFYQNSNRRIHDTFCERFTSGLVPIIAPPHWRHTISSFIVSN